MRCRVKGLSFGLLVFIVIIMILSSCAAPAGDNGNVVNVLPTVPVLSSPSDGENVLLGDVAFNWQNSTDNNGDVLTYRIYLSQDIENLNNGVQVNGNTFNRTFSAGEEGTWFWRIEVTDGKGIAVLSEEIRYITVGAQPTVEAQQQEDNELMVKDLSSNTLSLEWPEFKDTTNPGYEVEYSVYVLDEGIKTTSSRNTSRGADVVFSATTTNRNMNINTLVNNKHYRWMVLAAAQGGTKAKVGESEIRTGNTPPSTPVLKQPNDGMEELQTPVQLSWNASTDSDANDEVEYDVYVDTDSFPKKKVAKRIDETAIDSDDFKNLKLSEGTTYYWRVVAKDQNGGYAISSIFEFTTAGDASNNPVVEWVNVPEAVIKANEFTFEWSAEDSNGSVEYYEYKKDDFDTKGNSARAHSIWKKIEDDEYTWDNIPNGEHTFSVRAVDDEGNYSKTITTSFRVDLGVPQLEWITQATGVINTASFEFEWQAFDPSDETSSRDIIKYKFRKESYGTPENPVYEYGEWVFTEETEHLWENIPEGRNKFIVKAKNDKYVYSEELVCEFYYEKNNEGAPSIEWKTQPPEVIQEEDYKFEWIGSDNEESAKREIIEYQYAKDYFGKDRNENEEDWETTTDQFYNWEEIEFGKHSFSVRAVDDQGNFSEILTAFFYKSGDNPTVTWVEKPEETITDGKFTFRWSGTDANGQAVEFYEFKKEKEINETQRIYGEWIKTSLNYFSWFGIPEGKHRFSVRAVDKYGNRSEEITVEFVCDLPRPTVEWVKKPDEEIQQNYFDFEWIGFDEVVDEGTVSDKREIMTYKYRKISWPEECSTSEERGYTDSGWIFTEATGVRWENIPAGRHKMMVESKNDNYVYSEPIYAEFEYHPDPTKMPTVTWINIPADQISNNSFTFAWEGSDPEESLTRSIVKYEIAKGDSLTRTGDCGFEWTETEASSYTWADIPVGWHYFAVRAKDDSGNYSEVLLTDFVRYMPFVLEWVSMPGQIITQNYFRFEWRIKEDFSQDNNDITGYEYQLDYDGGNSERVADGWIQTTQSEYLWEDISEGNHSFVVRAIFEDGSRSQLLRSVFEYEKTEKIPVVQWVTKPATQITDDVADFEWKGFTETRTVDPDEVYAYEYKKISHDYINATTTESEWIDIQATSVRWDNIPVGYHRMILRAYTFNQQYSDEISCDFIRIPIGEGIPTLVWTDVPGSELVYDSFTFGWEGMDNSSSRNIVRYEIAKGNMPPEGQIPDVVWEQVDANSYEWTGIIQGYNYFAVRAIDDQNNYSMPLYTIFLCRGIPTEVIDDLMFIHHSCGSNWLGEGGLRTALTGKEYIDEVNEITYGTAMNPDDNRPASLGGTPGNNTDMEHWLYWFNDYLDGIIAQGAEDGRNKVVMFKSCYPASAISSVGSTETADPFSDTASLENYKAVFRYPEGKTSYENNGYDYKCLGDIFAEHQDTLFIVVTAPPLCWNSTNPEDAARAREFNNWLKYHWIEMYQEDHKVGDKYPQNVMIFDWFDFLANPSDSVEHANMLKQEYGGDSGDSHPNEFANKETTKVFATNENNFIDYAWEDFNR